MGLFDDDSQDDYLVELLLTATERVSELVGSAMQGVEVNDYYEAIRPRLQLSQPGASPTSVTVEVRAYQDDDDTETQITSGWSIDRTTSPPVLVFPGTMTWPMLNRATYRYPLRVTYTPEPVGDDVPLGAEQVRQALRYTVSVLFESRGTGVLPEAWGRNLLMLLGRHAMAV